MSFKIICLSMVAIKKSSVVDESFTYQST
jgi:hypothetical protein